MRAPWRAEILAPCFVKYSFIEIFYSWSAQYAMFLTHISYFFEIVSRIIVLEYSVSGMIFRRKTGCERGKRIRNRREIII